MPTPVRSPRLGLLGAESTGKTALAHALADAMDGVVATEYLREVVRNLGRPPEADEQRAIMLTQQDREDQIAATHPGRLVIGDPAPLMTAIYSIAYFQDRSLLDEAIMLAHGYDLIAWCDTDLPWQADDGQRDGPDARVRVHALVAELASTDMAGLAVRLVSGSIEERVRAVRRAWQQRPLSAPT